MDMSILRHLKGLKTVSAIEALIAFLDKREQQGEVFEYPIGQLAEDLEISRNTAKFAVKELERLGIILHVNKDRKNEQGRFQIIAGQNFDKQKNDSQNIASQIPDRQNFASQIEAENPSPTYKKAAAARKSKADTNPEIIDNINNIDFNNIDLYIKDINSMSVVNMNLYMTSKELGSLAKRLMNEVFLPSTQTRITPSGYAMQMKSMKDLLVQYRTEQVVAAIRYWTKINPPKNGITSLKFLTWSKKGKDGTVRTNIMEALDYYKQEYLAIEHEFNREEVEQRIFEQRQREEEEQRRIEEEKKRVEQMSSDEFVSQHMGRFSHLADKLRKAGGNT